MQAQILQDAINYKTNMNLPVIKATQTT
jgi:hypothetical protein